VVKTLVDYLNVYLGTFGFRALGIAEQRTVDGKLWPCTIEGAEAHQVNIELPTIYHRILSGPAKSVDEDGSPRFDDPLSTLTWQMRAVAVFDNIYCQDTEEKAILNLFAGLKLASTDAIAESLLISNVSYSGNSSERGADAWRAEFGTEYTYQYKVVYVDYDIEAVGFESCFTAQGCEDDIDVIDVIKGEYCQDAGPCEDATVNVNGETFGAVPSGSTINVPVVDSNGDPVDTSIVLGEVVIAELPCDPCPPCEDATITVNGTAYSTVASGGSDNIPVVNSDLTQIGTVTPGGNVTVGDSAITVNGDAYGSTPATVGLNVEVVDTNDDPVDITIAGGKVIVDDLPCTPLVIGAALPLKTGQTFVAEPDDDGANQIGRETDWFTLDYVNPWGHTYRFTGLGGGYVTNPLETNTVLLDWRNADGTPSTEASVVTDDIIIDWATLSRDATKVVMWYRVPDLTFRTFAAAMAQQAGISISTYVSNWKTPNHNLGPTIFFGGRIGHALSWFPMTKTTGVKATDLSVQWLSSEQGTFTTLAKTISFSTGNPMIGNLAKTSTRPQGLYCRIGTVSGTVIT